MNSVVTDKCTEFRREESGYLLLPVLVIAPVTSFGGILWFSAGRKVFCHFRGKACHFCYFPGKGSQYNKVRWRQKLDRRKKRNQI